MTKSKFVATIPFLFTTNGILLIIYCFATGANFLIVVAAFFGETSLLTSKEYYVIFGIARICSAFFASKAINRTGVVVSREVMIICGSFLVFSSIGGIGVSLAAGEITASNVHLIVIDFVVMFTLSLIYLIYGLRQEKTTEISPIRSMDGTWDWDKFDIPLPLHFKSSAYEESSAVVTLPPGLAGVFKAAAIGYLLLTFYTIFWMSGTLGHIILCLVLVLSHLYLEHMFKRWRVEVKDGFMIKTPMIGRKKGIPCEEIKEIVVEKSREIWFIKSNGERHAGFYVYQRGAKEILKKSEQYNIPIVEAKSR